MEVHAAEFPNVTAPKSELKAGRFQPGPLARRARDLVHERLGPPAKRNGLGLLRGSNDGRHESFKRHSATTHTTSVLELDIAVSPVQDLAHHFFRDVADGGCQWQLVGGQNRFHDARRQVVLEFAKRSNAALLHAQGWVGHQRLRVDPSHFAQSVAGRTCAVRTVEAEQVGFWFRVGESCGGTHQVPRKVHGRVAIQCHHGHRPLAERQGGLHRLEDAIAVLGSNDYSVHHSFDVVDLVAVHLESRFEFDKLSVDPRPEVPQPHDLFEQLPVMAFSAANHGREEEKFLAFKTRQNVRGNLVVGVPHHRLSRFQRKGIGCPCVEQPQEVVELSDGAHGGAGVFRNRLLLNGHHGTEPSDRIDIGPFQPAEELARVGTQRFQKPPLTLRVKRVECEAGFATATDPCEHHEFVARQHDVHGLEVVLRRPSDNQVILSVVDIGMHRRGGGGHGGSTIATWSGSPHAEVSTEAPILRTFHPSPATSMVIKGETQLKMQYGA